MAFYCLINHEKKFIACVNPKCGSSTIKDWFNQTLETPSPHWNRDFSPDMINATSVVAYRDYVKIFFIRDPLRRLVSFYYNWVVQDNKSWCFADEDRQYPLMGHTFSEFLHILEDLAHRQIRFQHHLEPQTHVLGSVPLDEIVKIEQLEERMVGINRRLGITYQPRRLNSREYATVSRPGAFNLRPSELAAMTAYSCESFFDDELEGLAQSIYREDVDFYESCL